MRTRFLLMAGLAAALLIAISAATILVSSTAGADPAVFWQKLFGGSENEPSIPQQRLEYDPVLGNMIAQINESEIYQSTYELQNISTRCYPSPGNRQAANYLYNRLVMIPGLEVEYPSDRYHNVIASLQGKDNTSGKVIIVGAHYDSDSSNPEIAPGATDNGCGVAIVLELARVMSKYQFNQTIQFGFWNAEESGRQGSTDYVTYASENSLDIPLYVNYDSSGYDPDNQYILDIIDNKESKPFAELLPQYNSIYDINFNLTFNVHGCSSDHTSFWQGGYPAITTHSQAHAPQVHTQNDTIDLISSSYAKKNAQLGMLILAKTAEIPPVVLVPADPASSPNGTGTSSTRTSTATAELTPRT